MRRFSKSVLGIVASAAFVAFHGCGSSNSSESEDGLPGGDSGDSGEAGENTGARPPVAGDGGTSSSTGGRNNGGTAGRDTGGESMGGVAGSGGAGEAGEDGGGTSAGGAAGAQPGGAGNGGGGSTSAGDGGGGSGGIVTCTHLTGRLRDFQPNTHPDFEPHMTKPSASSFYLEVETGIVQTSVDPATWKPIYAGDSTGTNTTIGPEHFPSWYIDTPSVNLGVDYALALTPSNGESYFSRTPFFPIDDGPNCPYQPQTPCLLGNSTNYISHNYAMTFELHVHFQYAPDGGQFVEFAGDDDTWLFVNGRLVMDLGGIHQQTVARVQFDTLDLAPGRTRLDFFWAERHVTSSNFDIRTNVPFLDCGVPAPE